MTVRNGRVEVRSGFPRERGSTMASPSSRQDMNMAAVIAAKALGPPALAIPDLRGQRRQYRHHRPPDNPFP